MTERRELTAYELECAKRLFDIWKRYKREHKVSQAWLGEKMGGMSQSAVGQYLNAKIPLNLSVVIKFSEALGCKASDIDPETPIGGALSDKERLIILAYRESDEKTRSVLLDLAQLALDRSKT